MSNHRMEHNGDYRQAIKVPCSLRAASVRSYDAYMSAAPNLEHNTELSQTPQSLSAWIDGVFRKGYSQRVVV